jgi:multisubunit Na+/H+ antiporter MnhG subunit
MALVAFLLVAGLLAVTLLAGGATILWVAVRGRSPDLYARLAYGGACGVVLAMGLFFGAIFAQYDIENILFHDLLQNGLLAVGLGGLLGVAARWVTLRTRA